MKRNIQQSNQISKKAKALYLEINRLNRIKASDERLFREYAAILDLLALPSNLDATQQALLNGVLGSAAESGNLDLANRLLEFPVVRAHLATQYNGALRSVAYSGNLDFVNRLLEFPAVRANVADQYNGALRGAAYSGNLDLVNRLLEFPAVRDNVAFGNNEALRGAAYYGKLDLVNRLLEFPAVRANVTARNNFALRKAVENGHLIVVYRLLDEDNVTQHLRSSDAKYLYDFAHKEGLLWLHQRLMTVAPLRTDETIEQEIEMVESRVRPNLSTLKAYVDSCKEQKLREQFTDNHVKVDEAFRCLILHGAADVPVKLTEFQNGVKHEYCFDYEILKQWYLTKNTNPMTCRRITWSEVEPAPDLVEKMQNAIHDAKQKQEKARKVRKTPKIR